MLGDFEGAAEAFAPRDGAAPFLYALCAAARGCEAPTALVEAVAACVVDRGTVTAVAGSGGGEG